MSYPIFVIFTVFVLSEVSWTSDVAPVMMDRAPGESFLNPMDISSLRDFNLFALVVTIIGSVLNRAAWIGNDTSSSGRNAHEQKMAGILGAWRNGFAYLMLTLIALFMITVMLGSRLPMMQKKSESNWFRKLPVKLFRIRSSGVKSFVILLLFQRPKHEIGVDKPYSRKHNPDTKYLEVAHKNMPQTPEGSTQFQKFRTLYYQMMAPTLLRTKLPVGIMGLFILLMVMLMISTDDSGYSMPHRL